MILQWENGPGDRTSRREEFLAIAHNHGQSEKLAEGLWDKMVPEVFFRLCAERICDTTSPKIDPDEVVRVMMELASDEEVMTHRIEWMGLHLEEVLTSPDPLGCAKRHIQDALDAQAAKTAGQEEVQAIPRHIRTTLEEIKWWESENGADARGAFAFRNIPAQTWALYDKLWKFI